jgi:hypothetical protein
VKDEKNSTSRSADNSNAGFEATISSRRFVRANMLAIALASRSGAGSLSKEGESEIETGNTRDTPSMYSQAL